MLQFHAKPNRLAVQAMSLWRLKMPRPVAFTGKQVTKLTGLPQWTLDYWEKTGVYVPAFVDERKRVPYRRIYDFRDLVSLRTLANLRREHRVPLEELRKAGNYLRDT